MLSLLLVSMLTLAFNVQLVKASGTIYIRSDGSVDPDTAPIERNGNIYTFTSNIYDLFSIVVERDNIVVDGAGYTIQGTRIHWINQGTGIDLTGRNNVTIKNMKINTFENGIYLYGSSNNNISGNNITNIHYGVHTMSSNYNTMHGNNITNNDYGIRVRFSSNDNSICGNNITNNVYGILLKYSSSNSISENNITNNTYGIYLDYSSDNLIYHNNFVDNTQQVHSYNSINVWDNGYPSGGNYWSDHNPPDLYSGPYQNETGKDEIGDIPYIIDENNTDRYPLIYPYGYVPSPDLNDDGKVTITDVVICALAFGSKPGDPNWDPYVDLNQDGKVTITDIVMIALDFGET